MLLLLFSLFGLQLEDLAMSNLNGSGLGSSSGSGAFGLSTGLIKIAALTSLIGSTATQALALGNKGPAGLVWATMTIFGAASIVKAGIATITPGWLRDTLGVRSLEADAAIGLSLNLKTNGIRYRTRSGAAKGIECEIKVRHYYRNSPSHSGSQQPSSEIRSRLSAEMFMSLISALPTS
jgi:hypothetical protein